MAAIASRFSILLFGVVRCRATEYIQSAVDRSCFSLWLTRFAPCYVLSNVPDSFVDRGYEDGWVA